MGSRSIEVEAKLIKRIGTVYVNKQREVMRGPGNEDVITWMLCVPRELRETVLRESHDSLAAGYVDSRKTIAQYYWPGNGVRAEIRRLRIKPYQRQAA